MNQTPQYAPAAIAGPPEQTPSPYSGLGTAESAGVGQLPWHTLTPIQQGWLQLAAGKEQLFEQLQRGELRVQELLNVLPEVTQDETLTTNLKVLQERIAEAKKVAAEHKEMRLSFTGMIQERIVKPAMAFEERSRALIDTAAARELDMRRAASDIAEKAAAVKREENALVAHISNEQYRIATDYNDALATRVHEYYQHCLTTRRATPDYEELKRGLREIKVGEMCKFNLRLLPRERAIELLNAMFPYDPNADLQAVIDSIPERFAMYAEDLKNADAAAKKAEEQFQAQREEAKAESELAIATNNIMAQAETVAIDAPKVKRKLEPVEENTQAWAFAVLAAFIKNNATAAPKLRTKSWAKVSIGQMAKALADVAGETGEMFQGLNFKEIEK